MAASIRFHAADSWQQLRPPDASGKRHFSLKIIAKNWQTSSLNQWEFDCTLCTVYTGCTIPTEQCRKCCVLLFAGQAPATTSEKRGQNAFSVCVVVFSFEGIQRDSSGECLDLCVGSESERKKSMRFLTLTHLSCYVVIWRVKSLVKRPKSVGVGR